MIILCLQNYLEVCWKVELASGWKKEKSFLKGKQVLDLSIVQFIIVYAVSLVFALCSMIILT